MEFDRFKYIIDNNKKYDEELRQNIEDFYCHIDCNYTNVEIPKIMNEIGDKLNVKVIEIPMKDSNFGAVFFNTTYSKYLLLNSNQARCKMYFAFCHDIYHVFTENSTRYMNEKREVHFNSDYVKDPNECKASLFAANLLMPEKIFRKMHKMYCDMGGFASIEVIAIKLMNYFNAPFISVLIRLFELGILKDFTEASDLLAIGDESIKEQLINLGIDDEIIKPTLNNQMNIVIRRLENESAELVKVGFMSEYSCRNVIRKVKDLYDKIVLNEQDIRRNS